MNKLIMILMLSLISNMALAESEKNPIAKKQADSELTVLGVIIGKSTLNEVKEKFKVKELYHEGEGETSLYAVCLKSRVGSTIAFESSDLGGTEHIINSISVNSSQAPYRLNQICEKTPMVKGKITLHKTSLGMSPDIVKRLTGKPSKQTDNTIEYDYEVQEKTSTGQTEIISSLVVEFKNSMSTKFIASKKEK